MSLTVIPPPILRAMAVRRLIGWAMIPLEWYSGVYAKRPLTVASITGCVVVGTGDIVAQSLVRARARRVANVDGDGVPAFNVRRFLTLASFGGLYSGYAYARWIFPIYEKYIPAAKFSRAVTAILRGLAEYVSLCF